jgi:hypothetical protein
MTLPPTLHFHSPTLPPAGTHDDERERERESDCNFYRYHPEEMKMSTAMNTVFINSNNKRRKTED